MNSRNSRNVTQNSSKHAFKAKNSIFFSPRPLAGGPHSSPATKPSGFARIPAYWRLSVLRSWKIALVELQCYAHWVGLQRPQR